jgi:hypothetical protein
MSKGLAGFDRFISCTALKKCVWGLVCQYITGVKSAGSLFLIHLLGGSMQTLSELIDEVQRLKADMPEVLGVHYWSRSNPSNAHFVVCRSNQEFINLKALYRDWDYSFSLINC